MEGGIIKDPNWGTYDANDFQSFTSASDYVAINPYGETNVSNYRAKYFPENTTQNYLQKETSYASIRVKFTPSVYVDENGTEKTTNGTADGTFWTVRLSNGTVQYFDDEAEADAYNNDNSGSKKSEYKEGYAYYNMYVNRDEHYDVIRNQYYKATVTDILGLGNPDPGPTEPEIPVETATNIKVDIEVVAWTLVEEDFQLIP